MNTIKIMGVALFIGAFCFACTTECVTCSATDRNDSTNVMTDELCKRSLDGGDRDEFVANFYAEHDPVSYEILCQ